MSLNEILLSVGSLILILGFIILIIAKNKTYKTNFREYINPNFPYKGETTQLYLFSAPSPSFIKVIATWKDKPVKQIKYIFRSYALKVGGLGGHNYGNIGYTDIINCKNRKTCLYKLDPKYRYELSFDFDSEAEFDVDFKLQIMKIEYPYEWIFPIGLTLLTIGTVIFVAGINLESKV